MRVQCPVETYTDNYVEYDERWSRAEVRRFGNNSADMIELMQRKITSIHIRLLDGEINSATEVTEEALDNMQWEVFQWFVVQPQMVLKEILNLGEAVRHQSSRTAEESPVTEDSTTQQLMPTS